MTNINIIYCIKTYKRFLKSTRPQRNFQELPYYSPILAFRMSMIDIRLSIYLGLTHFNTYIKAHLICLVVI